MNTLSIDVETFSDVDISKCGAYKYAESPSFEILLFAYAADGGEVQVVDLAAGEKIPQEILAALTDDNVIKWAFNANFERVCLSRYLSPGCLPQPRKLALHDGLGGVHGSSPLPCRRRQRSRT